MGRSVRPSKTKKQKIILHRNKYKKTKKNTNTYPATNINKNKKSFRQTKNKRQQRATPEPTPALMTPASLRRVETRIEPKSNQRKEVQVTSLACVPDKCLATEGHQPERYPQPPTRMTLHPTTLLY